MKRSNQKMRTRQLFFSQCAGEVRYTTGAKGDELLMAVIVTLDECFQGSRIMLVVEKTSKEALTIII
jgi:hypothetical protein